MYGMLGTSCDIFRALAEAEREARRALERMHRSPGSPDVEDAFRKAQERLEALSREIEVRETLSAALRSLSTARQHVRRGDFTAAREAVEAVRAQLDHALALRSAQGRQPEPSPGAPAPPADARVAAHPGRYAALEAVRHELLAGVLDPLTRGDTAAATTKLQALEVRLKALGAEHVPEPVRKAVQEAQAQMGRAVEAAGKGQVPMAARLLAAAATALGHGLEAALARKQQQDAAALGR